MSGDDKLKENIKRLFHPNRCYVYCKTQEEVDEFMDIAEYIGIKWRGYDIKAPRDSQYAKKYPIVFINADNNLVCAYPADDSYIRPSIPISVFRNYVIAVRNRRK